MVASWYQVRGYLAAGVALVACPCHLALTLPLLLTLTSGTALGAFLSRNIGVIVAASTAIFVGGLLLAFRWLGADQAQGPACPTKPAKSAQPRTRSEGQREEEALV